MEKYINRHAAGFTLLKELAGLSWQEGLVLALPRGGVPVAQVIAEDLNLPLDVFLVRKLGVPGQSELAFGAIAEKEICILNTRLIQELRIDSATIEKIKKHEQEELQRRIDRYRNGKELPVMTNKEIILVDDGIATGATLRAAIKSLKTMGVKKLIVAVPVAPPDVCKEISREVDQLICPLQPQPFEAVGLWYEQFAQVNDEEVIQLLKKQGQ